MSLKKAEAAKLSVNPDSAKHFPVDLFYCTSLTLTSLTFPEPKLTAGSTSSLGKSWKALGFHWV